jgi:hypothetical protein
MKTYRVTASSIQYYYVDVEADSENDAWLMAKDMDGADFTPDGYGDWDVIMAHECKEM